MKVTSSGWQYGAAAYQSSQINLPQKADADMDAANAADDACDLPETTDTDILETSAAFLATSRKDSETSSAFDITSAKDTGSNSSFKMKSSGPKNSVGELAAMLSRAETLMDVQLVLSKAMRALADLKMGAIATEGKEAKKYAQQIKRMEKLIKRIHKKVKHLSKEQGMEDQAKKAAKKAEVEKEKQIRQQLQARRKKRRREEREYALKEQATDMKNSLSETVSSMLSAASPSADVSSLTGGGDIMAADFSGIDMGSFDLMV